MRTPTGFLAARLFGLTIALLVFGESHELFAQGTDYKPGEKIEYKATPSSTVWEEGTFVEKSYDGSQPVIRFKPDQFFPKGEQKGLADWSQIRHLQAAPRTAPTEAKKPAPNPPEKGAQAGAPKGEATANGLMSQADIMAFLKARLGANPFANPRAEGELVWVSDIATRQIREIGSRAAR